MSRFIVPYNVLLIIFSLGSTLLLLGSPHQVDRAFLITNTASLFIFPLTAYFLYKFYAASKKANLLILLLLLTVFILFYYLWDLVVHGSSGIDPIIFYPILLLLLTVLFIYGLVAKRRNRTL